MGGGSSHEEEPPPQPFAVEVEEEEIIPSPPRFKLNVSNFLKISNGPLSDSYQVESTLRYGTNANIYSAIHIATGAPRCIKTIQKRNYSPDEIESIKRMAMELGTLDHPNIVHIYDLVEEESALHIVTELCTGGELLSRILRKGKASEGAVASIMQQILSAVHCCHEECIVLRHLKPDSILYVSQTENSYIKIQLFHVPDKLDQVYTGGRLGRYSMSPESNAGVATVKSDIFSCGVIMFILLCKQHLGGSPPTLNTARDYQKCFNRPELNRISSEAKGLLKALLDQEPARRPSAGEVLTHPWISILSHTRVDDRALESAVLTNMKNFGAGMKIEKAALHFIASQFSSSKETDDLRRIFRSLDANGDGKLSREELIHGYSMLGIANPKEVDRIMAKVDIDGSGFIDYTEFITFSMDWRKKLQNEEINEAFKAFDVDGSGTITVEELQNMLGGSSNMDDSVWAEMIQEADQDGDGSIDLNEFKELILGKIHRASINAAQS